MTIETKGIPAGSTVVVLGMHRSGTSALTGVLGELGCSLPRDPMSPHPMNPKGFMESDRITALDDDLLNALGSSWFDWRPLPDGWEESAPAQEFRDRALSELGAVYGDTELFVMKDPRICRLVPVWSAVLARAGREPLFVCTHRDPREVAASLDQWAGYDPAYSQLLWLRHVLDAEAATRGRPRTFTSYSRLMRDWLGAVERIAGDLQLEWPQPANAVGDAVETFLDGDLQRTVIDQHTDDGLSPWCLTAFEILERWAASGEIEGDHLTRDRLRKDLDHATPAFVDVVASGREADVRARRFADEIAATQSALESLQVEHAAAQAEQERLARQLGDLRLAHGQLRDDLDRAERERTILRRQASAEMRQRVLESLAELSSAQDSLMERDAQLRALRRQRRRLKSVIDERDQQLTALVQSRSWRITKPVRRMSALMGRTQSRPSGG